MVRQTKRKRRGRPQAEGILSLRSELTRKECKEWLEWFLRFLRYDQQEIIDMSPDEFKELMLQTLIFLYGDYYDDKEELRYLCDDTHTNRVAVDKTRGYGNIELREILQRTRISKRSERGAVLSQSEIYADLVIKNDQVYIIPYSRLRVSFRNVNLLGSIVHYRRSLSEAVPYSDVSASRIKQIEDVDAGIVVIIFDKACDTDFFGSLDLAFASIFSVYGIPRIGQCRRCRSYYVSTARKKSHLCRSCYSNKNVMKWRQRPENREAYNEYQRNLRKGIKEGGPAAIRDKRLNSGNT